jgi:hypothetical protein
MGMEFSFYRFGGTRVKLVSFPPRSKKGSAPAQPGALDEGPTEAEVALTMGTGVAIKLCY